MRGTLFWMPPTEKAVCSLFDVGNWTKHTLAKPISTGTSSKSSLLGFRPQRLFFASFWSAKAVVGSLLPPEARWQKREKKLTNTATLVGQDNGSQEALYFPRQTLTSHTLFQVFFKEYHLVLHQWMNEDVVVGLAKRELTSLCLIKCSTQLFPLAYTCPETISTTSRGTL